MMFFEISNSMQPYHSDFRVYTSKSKPAIGCLEPDECDEVSNRIPPTSHRCRRTCAEASRRRSGLQGGPGERRPWARPQRPAVAMVHASLGAPGRTAKRYGAAADEDDEASNRVGILYHIRSYYIR